MSTFSRYESFHTRAKCTQTASNDVISTGTRVGSRGGSPYNVLYCIICNCIVLPCIVFVLPAHVREAHFLQRYVVGYAADICPSKTLIGFRKTSFPKTELISLESAWWQRAYGFLVLSQLVRRNMANSIKQPPSSKCHKMPPSILTAGCPSHWSPSTSRVDLGNCQVIQTHHRIPMPGSSGRVGLRWQSLDAR